MKRSEAFIALEKMIDDARNTEETSRQIAIDLIGKLEELGMQPPAIKEPCETFVLHQGRYVKTEDSFMFTHKWDEE